MIVRSAEQEEGECLTVVREKEGNEYLWSRPQVTSSPQATSSPQSTSSLQANSWPQMGR